MAPSDKLLKAAMVLGLVVAAFGCGKKDEYASTTGTASPAATGTYETGRTTAAVPTQVMAQVVAMDTQASTITVVPVAGGAVAAPPGEGPRTETPDPTERGAAGAIANRRTIPVDASASADLARVKAGDRVTLLCSDTATGTTGTTGTTTGTTGTTTGTTGATRGALTLTSADLSECKLVTAIMPEAAGSARGR